MDHQPFKPAWWMKNPHLQTIVPSRLRKQRRPNARRHRLNLDDGDFIDLDIVHSSATQPAPVLLLFHGLEGSTESQYIQSMLLQAQHLGWSAIGAHFRGCSGEPNRLPRSYHSGEVKDLEAVIEYSQQCYPDSPLLAAGYSLGGSALLNLLSDSPYADRLTAACAVSVPFDLAECAHRMNLGFSRIYRNHFLQTLRNKLQSKQSLLQQHRIAIDWDKTQNKNDFWVFDHHVTAPLHGFNSVDDYYQRCSSRPKLKNIQRPTLLIHALDDPFMHPGVVPQQQELPDCIELELSRHGGHLGFVSGSLPFRPRYDWLEKRQLHFFQQQLNKAMSS